MAVMKQRHRAKLTHRIFQSQNNETSLHQRQWPVHAG